MNGKILLVDDNPGMIQVMARVLSGMGQLRFATSGEVALQQARAMSPDLILLDAEMPGMNGYEVCEALKADPQLADIPVIFVTAHVGQAFELKGFETGAVDFVAKPISEPLLQARVRTQLRIKHLTDELKRIATIDALTETLNRRAFDAALAREWRRCLRSGEAVSLLMVDVDHFKSFNDSYGHPAGDTCLRSVAQALQGAIRRPGDLVARFGGEEFVLLLPQTARTGAGCLANQVLSAIESMKMPHPTSPTSSHLTVSVGVACYDEASPCWVAPGPESRLASDFECSTADLLLSADRALYAAKRAGRDRAYFLDIAEVGSPHLAHLIARHGRSERELAPV